MKVFVRLFYALGGEAGGGCGEGRGTAAPRARAWRARGAREHAPRARAAPPPPRLLLL